MSHTHEGNVSMTAYETIVYLDGEEGREVVDQLCNVEGVVAHGPDMESIAATVEHLAQWDYGEEVERRPDAPWGSSDAVMPVTRVAPDGARDEYLLSWNLGLGYISLMREVMD